MSRTPQSIRGKEGTFDLIPKPLDVSVGMIFALGLLWSLKLSPYFQLSANIKLSCRSHCKSNLYIFVKYSVFAHSYSNRNQIDNQDGSLLSPENAARELGFFDEPEPHVVRLEYQRQGTDQDLGQECEYTMLTPHTMMVIQIYRALLN